MSVAISWTIRLWFIWAAIVYLCVACAASKNVKFNIQTQLQQFGWLERQTQGQSLVYPLALSVTSVATCTSVALRGAHPLHPLLTKPEMSFCLRNKAQTAAHISLPAAINLCSFFFSYSRLWRVLPLDFCLAARRAAFRFFVWTLWEF